MQKNVVDFNDIFNELKAANLNPTVLRKPADSLTIFGVVADSRKITPGLGFCALQGSNYDGHDFLTETNQDVSLAIIERTDLPSESLSGSAIIRVSSARAAWSQLASFFCKHPANKLSVIGITGTNGKTSTTWMIRSLLDGATIPCASIGTLGIHVGSQHFDTNHTTPDPDVLYPALANFVDMGIKIVVMEVSSHSLVQGKVWPIRFAGAGFTSFSQDHLDFHKNMDDYLAAKLSLFEKFLAPGSPAFFHASLVANEKVGQLLRTHSSFQTYGPPSMRPNYAVSSFINRLLGTTRVVLEKGLERSAFQIPMIGEVFAENLALAALLSCEVMKIPLETLETAAKQQGLAPVPGRLELVKDPARPWRPLVYVDYAHTPDALEKSLLTLTDGKEKPALVFGCGGDRDKSKRPIMGHIAARLASKIFVTNDNPRTEEPSKIIDDIAKGLGAAGVMNVLPSDRVRIIEDRKIAIHQAVANHHARDTLLIAGKGHENYQIIGEKRLPFSDQQEALDALSTARLWLVFGAGISGFAAAEHLIRYGDKVLISDDRPISIPTALENCVRLVALDDVKWQSISAVLASPGIPKDHIVYRRAADHGRPVISEIDLGLDGFPGKILAVTGTNGKSTTVAMTEYLGRESGVALRACGNIGLPPSALNLRSAGSDFGIVLEISSYQLEGSYPWPADAAVITSFSYDHLARHKTMQEYFRTKWLITKWLKPGAPLIISTEVAKFALAEGVRWPNTRTIVVGTDASSLGLPVVFEPIDMGGDCCRIDGLSFDFKDFGILGFHNQCNAIFSALMIQSLSNQPISKSFDRLREFSGLPFRCQLIFENQHIRVINDSKSTNLESTLSALTMTNRPTILLMGGQGKGESYAGLASGKDKIRTLITFGASARQIAAEASAFIHQIEAFEKMGDAVLRALHLARDNKVDILFSPGCASFDEFKNFEARGEAFNQLVQIEFKDFL